MRTADLVTALALMAVGVLVLADALRLGIGWGTDRPRSGFFPFWLAVALVSVAFPVVTFIVFERWFLVPMPKGPLEDWLGY